MASLNRSYFVGYGAYNPYLTYQQAALPASPYGYQPAYQHQQPTYKELPYQQQGGYQLFSDQGAGLYSSLLYKLSYIICMNHV